MTQDEILVMARQASSQEKLPWNGTYIFNSKKQLIEFAKLVEDKVRQEIAEKNAPVIKKVNDHIKELQDAVKAEREACAVAANEFLTKGRSPLGQAVSDVIRKRGEV